MQKIFKGYADFYCGGYMELLKYEYEESDKLEVVEV